MPRVALVGAAAAAGALGVAAVAGAVAGRPTIDVALQDNRAGTASKPRNVGRLTVTIATPITPGRPPSAATRAVIHFDEDLVFDPRSFGTCPARQVRRDASECPASSKLGGGGATATVFSGTRPAADVTPRVTAYSGPRTASGAPRIFLLVVEPQLDVTDVMTGTLRPDTGRYGRRLDVAIPKKLQNAGLSGVTISLTKLVTSVGGTRRGTPFVALKGCSGGRLDFKGDFTFTDGSTQSDTATAACRR